MPEFKRHCNEKLQETYKKTHWQLGQPEKAKVIFLSLDPNWSEELDDTFLESEILNYRTNSIDWIKTNKHNGKKGKEEFIHNPVLHKDYKGNGGVRFHRNFQKMDLNSIEQIEKISLVELYGNATVGQSTKNLKGLMNLIKGDDNKVHLDNIKRILFKTSKKTIFISKTVMKIILKNKLINEFPEIDYKEIQGNEKPERIINLNKKYKVQSDNTFIVHFHFSHVPKGKDYYKSELGEIVRNLLKES